MAKDVGLEAPLYERNHQRFVSSRNMSHLTVVSNKVGKIAAVMRVLGLCSETK